MATLREKIGQMVVIRASGHLFDRQIRYPAWEATQEQVKRWFRELNLGGVILLGGSAVEIASRTQQLQKWSKTPLLIAADIEEGVGQRFAGATWFPPPMALGEIARADLERAKDYSLAMGATTAQEALALGINWILAPVVDVNNNPDNPVINIRSFSDRPEVVGELASAFIRGAKSYPVLTTAKHFPGHGDTATDSHLDLPELPHAASRLESVELPPFAAAIAAGVDAVMSAHLLVPAWDRQNPATLSRAILTEQLRHNLGFEGLIVTDALIMEGIAQYAPPPEIALKAIAAGADILLMPQDPELTVNAVEEAVKDGKIPRERIEASFQKIRQVKQKLSAHASAFQAGDYLARLDRPESWQAVKEILNQTTVSGGNLPLKTAAGGKNRLVVDDLLNCDFLDRQAPAIALPESSGYQAQLFDGRNLNLAVHDRRPGILQLFIRGNPFRGSAGLSPAAQELYRHLFEARLVEGLIVYGSRYVLDWFRPLMPASLPWAFSYGQMPQAQAIACQLLLGISSDRHIQAGNFL